jgi:ribosomal protein RSM22 (predicted rRNA methylase)
MRLPDDLRAAIDEQLETEDRAAIARAAAHISESYKRGDFAATLRTRPERLAYTLVRMPATYAANARVFAEIRSLLGDTPVRSLLDLGAGPGTSMWAAAEVFPELERITLVERERGLSELGRTLAATSRNEAIRSARWIEHDLRVGFDPDPHDLVVISYALGELDMSSARLLLSTAWGATAVVIAIIEPGTPVGFGHVLAARTQLIAENAPLLAPCPHSFECPMGAVGDWCHFAQRLERTSEHRRIKGGELGYEDEKFSYVAAARTPVPLPSARIVRHPLKLSGHVKLTLCTAHGLDRATVTKSQKDAYRAARHAEWGDAWSSPKNKSQ